MKMPFIRDAIRLLLCIVLLPLAAQATQAVSVEQALEIGGLGSEPLDLTGYFAILPDPEGRLELGEVTKPENAARFKREQVPGKTLRLGPASASHWLRLRLRNSSPQAADLMLEVRLARFGERVEFYHPRDDGSFDSFHTGYGRPFSERPYRNHYYVFPIKLPPMSERSIHFRIISPHSLNIPSRLWERGSYQKHEVQDYATLSVYYGMALAMIAYNLLLFFALRDFNYLLYVMFVTSTAFTIAANDGIAIEFLLGEMPALATASTTAGASLMIITLILFMRRMIATQTLAPRLDKLLLAVSTLHLVMPVGLVLAFAEFLRPALALISTSAALILATAIWCAIRKSRSAIFFIGAFSALGIAGIMSALWGLGLVESSLLTDNGLQFGSGLEMIVLAIALADRFNEERKEKSKAQRQALIAQNEALLAQNQKELAQKEALLAQTQLAQSEKMAALGQLISGVTHEINTPIGAVKSSGMSITDSLEQAMSNMPALFRSLDEESSALFLKLIGHAHEPAKLMSSREERALVRETSKRLEEAGIDQAQQRASLLVQLHAQAFAEDYLPLLRHPEWERILETARNVAGIVQSAHNINTAVDRATKIIRALKSFAHFDRDEEFTEAQLADGIETVLTLYQGQLKHGVELIRNYEDMPSVRCLPDELSQVWTNLIHNALHAMNNQGTLTITIRRDGDQAVVSVSDTGSGIPDEIRSKIFDVFFTTKPAGIGSGLGLDIVRKIVDKHKGRIDVQSEVGVGTTFSIFLPV